MDERTYRVLNSYDMEVPYSFAIPFRNMTTTISPFITSLLAVTLILLRDSNNYSVFFTIIILYTMLLLCMIITFLVFKFLEERRKFLVQNKLEYLQKKYAKLGTRETEIYEERRRPRVRYGSVHDRYDEDFVPRNRTNTLN